MSVKNPVKKRNSPGGVRPDITQLVGQEYVGQFKGSYVEVTDHNMARALSLYGNFGKGSLSKNTPIFNKDEDELLEIIYESQYKRRKEWTEERGTPDDDFEEQNHLSEYWKTRNEKMLNSLQNLLAPVTASSETWSSYKNVNFSTALNTVDPKQMSTNESIQNLWKEDMDHEESGDINSLKNIMNSKLIDFTNPICIKTEKQSIIIPDLNEESDMETILKQTRIVPACNVVKEKLILSLQEAFYLSFNIKCLKIYSGSNEITNENLWFLFNESEVNFKEKYAVYQYYRRKGWVVRSGLKFGGHFSLYKVGPAYYHASYVVWIEILNELEEREERLTWNKLIGFNRMLETAKKELILCQIRWPSQSQSIDNLPNVQIKEVIPKRWVPSLARSKK